MENGILDVLTEGIIVVDDSGVVKTFNRKAREIFFGMEELSGAEYDSGILESRDIVILAITSLGQDDGHLDKALLEKMGITTKLNQGTAIVAIGKIDDGDLALVKTISVDEIGTKLEMTKVYENRRISVQIDLKDRHIDILVDGRNYPIQFIQSFGHMVVIDGRTGKVKFVQSHGYSFRKESIGDLLRGRTFQGKGSKSNVNLIGMPLVHVLNEPELVSKLSNTASGASKGFESKYMNIHGRPVLCSLRGIRTKEGANRALLVVEDVSEFNMLIRERNTALRELENIREKLLVSKNSDLLPEIIGSSISMNRVKQLAKSASASKSTVLLLGESGTGKNVVAEAIHKNSSVSEQPFIQVNCGALPEHLIESELFGYASGAFSGASSKGKPGFFELANGGVLFLDEVGEIPPHVQVKLLHAIQHCQFFRVGGTKPVSIKVRIIAATNKNLDDEVLEGRFREDLYYRLNVLRITIPPLRERREDIRELVENLMPRICSRLDMKFHEISPDALYMLQNHNFPGNVRELENILERAINLAHSGLILPEHLLLDTLGKKVNYIKTPSEIKPLKEVVQQAEKTEIMKALNRTEGDRELAIKDLGIGKSSFYEKIKKYNISY